MKFIEFFENSVSTNGGIVFLQEGIDHIEALPVTDFIHAVENIATFTATEKLDGANLTFGFDKNGKFYTNRQAKKSTDKRYSADEWENSPANNGFKSAHAALEKITPTLKQVIKRGEAVEVEVLFGRQPNAIVYGSSYIAVLRMVVGDNEKLPDQEKVKHLRDIIEGKTVTVTTPHVITKDGIDLEVVDLEHTWKFTSTAFVESHHFKKVNVEKELTALKRFLQEKNTNMKALGLTNGDVTLVKLASIPTQHREAFKTERDRLLKHINEYFKLPIKEKLLDAVIRKLNPKLRDVDIHPHEDTGVEGVVLLDPKTLKQFKLVDKDVFTIINNFNFAIRSEIKNTGIGGKRVEGITLGIEGDIFGNMLKRIANILGIEQLGRYIGIKQVLRKYAGSNIKETLSNFAADVGEKNVATLKHKITNALDESIQELSAGFKKYNEEWKTYAITLKTGKEVRYTDEIHNRTLSVFAEVRREMNDIRKHIENAQTVGEMLVALYGKQLKTL